MKNAGRQPWSASGLNQQVTGRRVLTERQWERPRLAEIIHNLRERITEARMNGWLGEVQGLEVSLEAAKRKLASLDRSIERNRRTGPADLGMPAIGQYPVTTSILAQPNHEEGRSRCTGAWGRGMMNR